MTINDIASQFLIIIGLILISGLSWMIYDDIDKLDSKKAIHKVIAFSTGTITIAGLLIVLFMITQMKYLVYQLQ